MLTREQTVWLVVTILFFLIFIFLYTRQPTVYYAAQPWEAPKPPAPQPAPGQALPLAANPSAAFSDTNLFGKPSQPFVLKKNEIKPSTEPAPDSLRYTNISGLKPMTSITAATGPTSSDSSPLYSGPPPRASVATRAATRRINQSTVARLDPVAKAALDSGLISFSAPVSAPVGAGATKSKKPSKHAAPARTPQQATAAAATLASAEAPPAPVVPTDPNLAEGPSETPAAQVPAPSVPQIQSTKTSTKKGFVAGNNDPSASAKIASLNVAWYYTWGSTPPVPPPPNLEFTPMFWNISKAPKAPAGCAPTATPPATVNALCTLQTIKALPVATTDDVILAYNEPDGTNASAQGNMNTADAANFWPNIVAIATRPGCRLGSPVMYGSLLHSGSGNVTPIAGVTAAQTVNISNDSTKVNHVVLDPTIWLDNFLIRVSQQQNPRYPDIITVHWYGPPNANSFLTYLQNIYTKYNLPIWVTEYSCADWKATTTSAGVTTHTALTGVDWSIPTDANKGTATSPGTNSTAAFMQQTVTGMEAMPFVERFSWKERFLLSDPSLNYPNSMFPLTGTPDSVMGPSNPDVMNQSTLFASYQHFPTSLPPLTPLGKLYASL